MDIEVLISAVREKTPLWNMKDTLYHHRDVQRKLWDAVAQQLAAKDVADVKKRWKGIRDVFRREYAKYLKSGQEAPDEFVSSWPYFNHMMFLRDVIEPRNLKGNLTSPNKNDAEAPTPSIILTSGNPAMTSTAPSTSASINPQAPPMPPPQTAPPGPKNKKIRGCSNKEEFLQIERQKLRLFADKTTASQDSDYQFLISLHPYLKAVPAGEKLAVRQKLQQVLLDVQNTMQPSSSSIHSSPSAWTIATDESSVPSSQARSQDGGLGGASDI